MFKHFPADIRARLCVLSLCVHRAFIVAPRSLSANPMMFRWYVHSARTGRSRTPIVLFSCFQRHRHRSTLPMFWMAKRLGISTLPVFFSWRCHDTATNLSWNCHRLPYRVSLRCRVLPVAPTMASPSYLTALPHAPIVSSAMVLAWSARI